MALGGKVGVPVLKFKACLVPPRRAGRTMLSTVSINCELVSATRCCGGRGRINRTVGRYNVSHRRLFVAAGM